MVTRGWRLALAVCLAVGSVGGCNERDEGQGSIDVQPLADAQPETERPGIKFPIRTQQEDVSLNKFIGEVLRVCERGDYDGLCRLFGANDVPPTQAVFRKTWLGVREIEVVKVVKAKEEPPIYLVHAAVRLREEDSKHRMERDVVIQVYKELDQWRMSGGTGEFDKELLLGTSQPATAPEAANVR